MRDLRTPFYRQLITCISGSAMLCSSLTDVARGEVIDSNTGAASGSSSVAPYPAAGTNVITWLSAGSPGTWVQIFTVPSSNYVLSSVTLNMGDAPKPGGGFTLSLRTVSSSGGAVSLNLVEYLSGTDNPSIAGSYIYTGSATLTTGATYVLVAEVSAGGGVYSWNRSTVSSASTAGFALENGASGPTLGGVLDLNDAVVFLFSDQEFLFTVEGTRVVVPSLATVTSEGNASSPAYLLTDAGAINSLLFSSVPTALAQRELALGGSQTTLRDFAGRLFRLRAGAGREENRIVEGQGDGVETESVLIGEGDGVQAKPSSKGAKVVMGKVNPDALRWEVFTSFDYGNLDMDASKSFQGLQSDTYAETLGIEYALTDHLVMGGGISYLQSFSEQSTDVDGVTLATYLSGTWGSYYADVLYGATLLDHEIDRATGLGSSAHAEPDSTVHAVNFNTGYNFYFGNWTTGPFAGVDYARANIDGYTENGGGTAATRVSDQTVDSLVTRLGWQTSYRQNTSWGAITPQLRLGWERENQRSDDSVDVSLAQSPFYLVKGSAISSKGGRFEVTAAGQDRRKDYLTAGAGLRLDIGARLSLSTDYDGFFFSDGYAAHFGKLTLSWKF